MRFQIENQVLRVNKRKVTDENTFNRDDFGIERNHGSSKNKKNCFGWFAVLSQQTFAGPEDVFKTSSV